VPGQRAESETERSLRFVLAGVAALAVTVGGLVLASVAQTGWALDIARDLAASRALLSGGFGGDHGYLYSPFAAVLTVPLLALPSAVAAIVWLAGRLAVIAWLVRRETGGLRAADAALVGLAVVAFVPTLYDLLVGNVSVLVVGAVAMVWWRRDTPVAGIAVGLVVAAVPKPQLVPILIWMLMYRQRALAGAVATVVVATLVTIALVGVGPYLAWFDILRAPDYLHAPMVHSLTPDVVLPGLEWPVRLAAVAGFLVSLRRGETNGFIGALAAGLVLAPYTLAYAAMALLLAVRSVALAAPIVALALSAIGSVAVLVLLPIYALAWLLVACVLRFEQVAAKGLAPQRHLATQAALPPG
jgi:hypothetical protein